MRAGVSLQITAGRVRVGAAKEGKIDENNKPYSKGH